MVVSDTIAFDKGSSSLFWKFSFPITDGVKKKEESRNQNRDSCQLWQLGDSAITLVRCGSPNRAIIRALCAVAVSIEALSVASQEVVTHILWLFGRIVNLMTYWRMRIIYRGFNCKKCFTYNIIRVLYCMRIRKSRGKTPFRSKILIFDRTVYLMVSTADEISKAQADTLSLAFQSSGHMCLVMISYVTSSFGCDDWGNSLK